MEDPRVQQLRTLAYKLAAMVINGRIEDEHLFLERLGLPEIDVGPIGAGISPWQYGEAEETSAELRDSENEAREDYSVTHGEKGIAYAKNMRSVSGRAISDGVPFRLVEVSNIVGEVAHSADATGDVDQYTFVIPAGGRIYLFGWVALNYPSGLGDNAAILFRDNTDPAQYDENSHPGETGGFISGDASRTGATSTTGFFDAAASGYGGTHREVTLYWVDVDSVGDEGITINVSHHASFPSGGDEMEYEFRVEIYAPEEPEMPNHGQLSEIVTRLNISGGSGEMSWLPFGWSAPGGMYTDQLAIISTKSRINAVSDLGDWASWDISLDVLFHRDEFDDIVPEIVGLPIVTRLGCSEGATDWSVEPYLPEVGVDGTAIHYVCSASAIATFTGVHRLIEGPLLTL